MQYKFVTEAYTSKAQCTRVVAGVTGIVKPAGIRNPDLATFNSNVDVCEGDASTKYTSGSKIWIPGVVQIRSSSSNILVSNTYEGLWVCGGDTQEIENINPPTKVLYKRKYNKRNQLRHIRNLRKKTYVKCSLWQEKLLKQQAEDKRIYDIWYASKIRKIRRTQARYILRLGNYKLFLMAEYGLPIDQLHHIDALPFETETSIFTINKFMRGLVKKYHYNFEILMNILEASSGIILPYEVLEMCVLGLINRVRDDNRNRNNMRRLFRTKRILRIFLNSHKRNVDIQLSDINNLELLSTQGGVFSNLSDVINTYLTSYRKKPPSNWGPTPTILSPINIPLHVDFNGFDIRNWSDQWLYHERYSLNIDIPQPYEYESYPNHIGSPYQSYGSHFEDSEFSDSSYEWSLSNSSEEHSPVGSLYRAQREIANEFEQTANGYAPKYTVQSGYSDEVYAKQTISNLLKSFFQQKAGEILYDNKESLYFHLEALIDTIVLMYNSKSWVMLLLQIKSYLMHTFKLSATDIIFKYIMALFKDSEDEFENGYTTQSGMEKPSRFREIFGDWKGFINGEFIKKISQAVACIISLGFCTLSNIPFCTDRFSTFYEKSGIADKHWSDLLTMLLDTAIYIFDNCMSYFKGDLAFMDILRSPSASYKYEKELRFLQANVKLYEENSLDTIDLSRSEYEIRLFEIEKLTKSFYERSSGSERRLMALNILTISQLQNRVVSTTVQMSIRPSPFTFALVGETSIGKTSVLMLLYNLLMRANLFNPDKKFFTSINASDAYQSEVQTFHEWINADDFGNTKAEHETGVSTQLIIDYVNNDPKCALKADVDSKGKVFINPSFFTATTNVKNLDAHYKSNEPLSILRRMGYFITMEVKPEYRKRDSHFLDPSKMVDAINDAWYFLVQVAKPLPKRPEAVGACQYVWETVKNSDGYLMEKVGLNAVISFLKEKSRAHFVQQQSLIKGVNDIHQMELCPHDSYKAICDDCLYLIDDLRVQAGKLIEYDDCKKYDRLIRFVEFFTIDFSFMDRYKSLYDKLISKSTKNAYTMIDIWSICCATVVNIGLYLIGVGPILFCVSWVTAYYVTKLYLVINYVQSVAKDIQKTGLAMIQPVLKKKYHLLAGAGVTVGILAFLKFVRSHKKVLEQVVNINTQGAEYSTPKPDKNPKENCWIVPEVTIPPCSTRVATATFDQVRNTVGDALVITYLEKTGVDKKNWCIMLPIKGNVFLAPYHLLQKDFNKIYIQKSKSLLSPNRSCPLESSMWMRIGETDLCLLSLPVMGDNRDIIHLFPNKGAIFNTEVVTWVSKDRELDRHEYRTQAKFHRVKFQDHFEPHLCYDYMGWRLELDRPTSVGLCGSPIISNGIRPLILGVHSAGIEGQNVAIVHYITSDELVITYDALFNRKLGDSDHINVQCASTDHMQLSFPDYNIKHLGKIHFKSPFCFHEGPAVVSLYGAHDGMRRRFTSAVENTIISDSVTRHLGIEPAHGPPMNIGNWKPWYADSMKSTRNNCLLPEPLKLAVGDLESTILEFLENHLEYKDLIHPMSRVATLSGVDGCNGIDSIKLKTSAGFPRCKPKRNYVFESDEVHEHITRPLDVSPEIWETIDDLEKKLMDGKRVYFIHRINLKDEPIALGKEKVRTFAGCSLECLILVRMYFLPILKMMMDNSEIFECAVGVNAHGPEWTKITEHMQKFGIDRTIAGDYKDYDLMVWCVLTMIAFNIMIGIAKFCGYSEEQLTLMRGLATELCFGLTEYNGEYVMFFGRNLSGHPATVFINNLINSLYCRYAYYDIYESIKHKDENFFRGLVEHLDLSEEVFQQWKEQFCNIGVFNNEAPKFADVVSLMCYGDDNKMSVREDVHWFNHTTMQYSLKRVGLDYTMADKETKTVPFISASDCSFLKRHSVWSDDFNQYLGPLELKSMIKTLHVGVVSKVITRQQQAAEALDSVIRELFYHGRDIFESWRCKLQIVLEECELEAWFSTRALHTYDYLESEYKRKYLLEPDIKNVSASNSIDEIAKTEVLQLITQCGYITDINSPHCAFVGQGKDSYLGICSPAYEVRPHALDNPIAHVVYQWIANNNNTYTKEMGPQTHQNVVFRDGTEQYSVDMNGYYDETRKVGMDQTTSLEDFFRRPVKYNLSDWVVGSATPYSAVFDPWNVFFTNPRVSNRISNFKLLQCTLKVKFMINGNSFYYGRLLVDYAPLAIYRNIEKFDTINLTNVVAASQRMHIYLNPTSSQGGELHLPFVHPQNALDITAAEWAQMGTMTVRELTSLKHANGSTQNSSISCYIWAENVVLSIPTTRNASGISVQAGEGEYKSKPISNIASTIADIANRLSTVPIIGPYMKATNMISSSIGNVAKLFGFSRPIQLENSIVNKPRLISGIAVTDTGDSSLKLTVDSKQELSIDPKIVGLDVNDELVLHEIAGKESYLTNFTWTTTAVTDDILWNTRCHPMNCVTDATTIKVTYRLPACTFAALPFSHWRGTMRYRFQIVASDYHRGRLRFVFDPSSIASVESNVIFTRIVDLCDERDFVMDVAWGQTTSYLDVVGTAGWLQYGTTAFSGNTPYSNGVLGVYVLNELTTPNSSVNNDIKINVFQSMCDDCEFAVPSSLMESVQYNTQSGEEDGSYEDITNAPVIETSTDHILPCLIKDHTNDVYFGEKITSFRQLLKRYSWYNALLSPGTGDNTWAITIPDFPVYRGTFDYGLQLNAVAAAANINRTTMLQYVSAAFLAKRGGVRWKYMYNTDKPSAQQYVTVTRMPIGNTPAQGSTVTPYTVTTSTAFSNTAAVLRSVTACGTEVTPSTQQPVMEFESPNYSRFRFAIPQNASSLVTATAANFSMYANRHRVSINDSNTARSYVDMYVAGAEDLTFIGFQGCPPISFAVV